MRILLLGWLIILAAAGSSFGSHPGPDPAVAREIEHLLAGRGLRPFAQELRRGPAFDALATLYAENDYSPLWRDQHRLNRDGLDLISLLRQSADHGLCPEDYHVPVFDRLLPSILDAEKRGVPEDPSITALLDIFLSSAFLQYAGDMIGERSRMMNQPDSPSLADRVNLKRLLVYAATGHRVLSVLNDLTPNHDSYRHLQRELKRYRELMTIEGFPEVADGPVIAPGDRDRRVGVIRQILYLLGDFRDDEGGGPPREYDAATVAAVVRFQIRHGLAGSGIIGPETVELLNTPLDHWVDLIIINMERWRWLSRDLQPRRIEVNIADYRLSLFDQDREALSMAVIVGSVYRKTPVFSSMMTYLELSPYWTVPPTVLREDLMPKIRNDIGFFDRHGYEIISWDGKTVIPYNSVNWSTVDPKRIPGYLRRKPGASNPLGRVKFMFPNPYAVYLHDTPNKNLFTKEDRTLSSGCIRVERPVDLAEYLLEGEKGWSRRAIERAMNADSPSHVSIPRPIPVYLLYRTAWVDPQGTLQFRPDIYGRDLPLMLLLRGTGRAYPAIDTPVEQFLSGKNKKRFLAATGKGSPR